MTSTLDHNMPIPPMNRARMTLYPWRTMAVGQSFFAPVSQVTASHWSRKTGCTYVTRAVVEDGIRGVRVWRTA
jgi:hypothetical protein